MDKENKPAKRQLKATLCGVLTTLAAVATLTSFITAFNASTPQMAVSMFMVGLVGLSASILAATKMIGAVRER